MTGRFWAISSLTGRMALFSHRYTYLTYFFDPYSSGPFRQGIPARLEPITMCRRIRRCFFWGCQRRVSSLRSPFFQFQIHPLLFPRNFCQADSTSGATTALQLTKPGFGRFNEPSGACDGTSSMMESVALRAPTSFFSSEVFAGLHRKGLIKMHAKSHYGK
mgnify:CR=1 FL=1